MHSDQTLDHDTHLGLGDGEFKRISDAVTTHFDHNIEKLDSLMTNNSFDGKSLIEHVTEAIPFFPTEPEHQSLITGTLCRSVIEHGLSKLKDNRKFKTHRRRKYRKTWLENKGKKAKDSQREVDAQSQLESPAPSNPHPINSACSRAGLPASTTFTNCEVNDGYSQNDSLAYSGSPHTDTLPSCEGNNASPASEVEPMMHPNTDQYLVIGSPHNYTHHHTSPGVYTSPQPNQSVYDISPQVHLERLTADEAYGESQTISEHTPYTPSEDQPTFRSDGQAPHYSTPPSHLYTNLYQAKIGDYPTCNHYEAVDRRPAYESARYDPNNWYFQLQPQPPSDFTLEKVEDNDIHMIPEYPAPSVLKWSKIHSTITTKAVVLRHTLNICNLEYLILSTPIPIPLPSQGIKQIIPGTYPTKVLRTWDRRTFLHSKISSRRWL